MKISASGKLKYAVKKSEESGKLSDNYSFSSSSSGMVINVNINNQDIKTAKFMLTEHKNGSHPLLKNIMKNPPVSITGNIEIKIFVDGQPDPETTEMEINSANDFDNIISFLEEQASDSQQNNARSRHTMSF